MAAAARNWGDYIRGELNSINAASRLTDLKTLREIVDTLRVVVNRCCAAEEDAEGLEEPPAGATAGAGNLAAEQAAEPHEWVRNGDDEYRWFKNSVTGETAWELPPGAILKENVSFPPSPTSSFASSSAASQANENERPPPPPAPAAGPAFATAANRAAARGAVPPPSGALPPRAGRLAPNIMGCDGVTPEDCRVARMKLRRANSQLASASASVEEPVTPPGTPGREQSGGKRRRGISRKKKNRRGCNYRRTNRRFTER
jgi:hypothetical protein